MIMFWQKFKNNVKNEFMRDKRKINDLKILMKATIDFDDWLYKRIMKRKYSKRHSKKIENYINNQIYENKMNSICNNREYDYLKTILMKLNSIIFRKFKQKKMRIIRVTKKITLQKITNQKTLFDDNSTLRWKKNSKHKKKNIDYETIEISSIDFKNEKFHKIDELQNFQNVLNKKNKTAIWRLRKLTQQLTISISTNLCFNDSKHFIQIQQKKLKSIKIKIIKQMQKW